MSGIAEGMDFQIAPDWVPDSRTVAVLRAQWSELLKVAHNAKTQEERDTNAKQMAWIVHELETRRIKGYPL